MTLDYFKEYNCTLRKESEGMADQIQGWGSRQSVSCSIRNGRKEWEENTKELLVLQFGHKGYVTMGEHRVVISWIRL